MRNILLCAVVGIVALCGITGCATIRPATITNQDAIDRAKIIDVLKHKNSKRKIEVFIANALQQKGYKVRIKDVGSDVTDSDLYIEFVDRWQWDLSLYLFSLRIEAYDSKNRQLIAIGKFEQSGIHTYPDPDKTTHEVIDTIFHQQKLTE